MKHIKLKGKEYLLIINNRVIKDLFVKHGKDVFAAKEDGTADLAWTDDPDIISYVGYKGLQQGAVYDDIELPFTEKQFSAMLGRVEALEISNEVIKEVSDTFEYMAEKLPKGDKDEDEKK